jgi:hypothetical protein
VFCFVASDCTTGAPTEGPSEGATPRKEDIFPDCLNSAPKLLGKGLKLVKYDS